MLSRFIGIDIGAETVKTVELVREGAALRWSRRQLSEHRKDPGAALLDMLRGWDWEGVAGATVCGRFGRRVTLAQIPVKQAQAAAWRALHGQDAHATVVSIGSHGFSAL
jgi:hypothetical protein